MKLYSHPVIKFRTKDRLHISKEPGLLSRLALISVTAVGIVVDYYFMPDYFILHAAFLSFCLVLSLNFIKTWDLVMDREENLGTIINRSWYHVFSIRVPEENVQRFPLTSVESVVVSPDLSIDIHRRDGTQTRIISEGSDYRSLKDLRREISSFLSLERIEYLKDTEEMMYEWEADSASSSGVSEIHDSDTETPEINPIGAEFPVGYGSNIKIITGIS